MVTLKKKKKATASLQQPALCDSLLVPLFDRQSVDLALKGKAK